MPTSFPTHVTGDVFTAAHANNIQIAINAIENGGGLRENETLGGTPDGVLLVFTTVSACNPTASMQLFKDGVFQILGTDYTISGTNVTFTVAPATGAKLRAFYRY